MAKQQKVVRYRAQRLPGPGSIFYLANGIAYGSLDDLRAAHPGARLERIKATRRNRLYG